MPMNRRHFLRLAAFAAAIGLVPEAGAEPSAAVGALGHPELLDVLGPKAVRAIGAHYRTMHPSEDDARVLVDAIPFDVAGLVREDFARGRTVVVDGWLLSTTEARQCALFSLLAT
jgi:hypothetical protein